VSQEALGILMLALLVAAIFVGFPTAFTLMALGFIFGYLGFGRIVFDLMVQRAFFVMTNDVLITIPLFIFMGYVLERSGVLDRLFRSILVASGPLHGSLALSTLLTSTLFAMATGIIGASVTIMGLLALPAMMRLKYDKQLATGTIAAGGTLGILIPPSVLLILYAANAGESIVRLYLGAFVPGFLLSGLYIAYVVVVSLVRPEAAPALPKEERNFPIWQILLMLVTGVLPMSLLIFSVLGSIAFGLAAPTEAAAMGGLGALALAAVYRKLTWENLEEAVFRSIRTSSMVLTLLVGSSIFAAVFARLGGASVVENFVLGLGLSTAGFIWLAMAIIFLLGWPLKWTEIIIIFVPIFLPMLDTFKVDPIFFGILVALNTQTAFNTLPVAMAAFYLKGVAPPHVTLADIFRGALPFVFMVFLCMAAVYVFPGLALWLPDYLYTPR
jgi:tripartite ATP-independent transporter DctM subunit